MWWFVIQNAVFSLCIIIIIHYLWEYFKVNYTTRKTKHIVDTQTQKYRDIINEMHNTSNPPDMSYIGGSTSDDYISEEDKTRMIHDLTQFLHTESVAL
jgi:hypothetical protein